MVKNITVLEPFLTKPFEELHLAELSRELNEPHPTIRQHLNNLEKEGILKKKIKGRLTLYSLNFNNPLLLDYITLSEKNKLITMSENLILKEMISFFNENFSETTRIIFGSFAERLNKPKDIDLIIVGKIDNGKIKTLSKKINKEIHLINVKSLNDITKTLKEEVIKKHIVLNNTEEAVRWLQYTGAKKMESD